MTQMSQANLIDALSATPFSDRYWSLCDAHSARPMDNPSRSLTKMELLAAFDGLADDFRYDSRDRSIVINLVTLGGRAWEGVFSAQRSGLLELALVGDSGQDKVGNNFAVLAYEAKRKADPNFSRDRFSGGPAPYPRPSHNGQVSNLNEIARGFLELLAGAIEAMSSFEERAAGLSA